MQIAVTPQQCNLPSNFIAAIKVAQYNLLIITNKPYHPQIM